VLARGQACRNKAFVPLWCHFIILPRPAPLPCPLLDPTQHSRVAQGAWPSPARVPGAGVLAPRPRFPRGIPASGGRRSRLQGPPVGLIGEAQRESRTCGGPSGRAARVFCRALLLGPLRLNAVGRRLLEAASFAKVCSTPAPVRVGRRGCEPRGVSRVGSCVLVWWLMPQIGYRHGNYAFTTKRGLG